MKYLLGLAVLLGSVFSAGAQEIDSIFFNLYTDSLKKGQHNYINVDGKLRDGSWQPLTTRELDFSSTAGKFSGNELIIPADFKEEKVTVKATLRSNPAVRIERTIWIKRLPDPDTLPTEEEILNREKKKRSRTREA